MEASYDKWCPFSRLIILYMLCDSMGTVTVPLDEERMPSVQKALNDQKEYCAVGRCQDLLEFCQCQ